MTISTTLVVLFIILHVGTIITLLIVLRVLWINNTGINIIKTEIISYKALIAYNRDSYKLLKEKIDNLYKLMTGLKDHD